MLFKWENQNPFPGEGLQQGPTIPWLASTYTNNPKIAGLTPGAELGQTWPEAGVGNVFQDVYLDVSGETAATLSAGCVLMATAPKTDTVASSLTDTATGIVYGVVLTTGGLTVNKEIGNFAWFQDLGVMRQIESNTATNLIFAKKGTIFGNNVFDPNYLPAAPGGGTNVAIIRPFHVTICDATHPPLGIVVNDVLEGQPIVMQVRGLALILGNNSGVTTAVNIPAITAASGIIEGGSATAAALGDAVILPQVAYDGPTLLLPCYFKGCGF